MHRQNQINLTYNKLAGHRQVCQMAWSITKHDWTWSEAMFRTIDECSRGEWGTLDVWVRWAGLNIFVIAEAFLLWLTLKIPFLISIYPKKFREDRMRYAGFVMNFLFFFFAKKVILRNFSCNLTCHCVLEIKTSRVMSNQLWQLGYSLM